MNLLLVDVVILAPEDARRLIVKHLVSERNRICLDIDDLTVFNERSQSLDAHAVSSNLWSDLSGEIFFDCCKLGLL